MNIAGKLWRSATVTTWISMLIRIGGLALLLPLVLTRLSVQDALVWQMLATVSALVLWLDFGFSPTFARLIAFSRGGGNIVNLHAGSYPSSGGRETPDGARDLAKLIGTQRRIYYVLVGVAVLVSIVAGTAALAGPISQLEVPWNGWVAWGLTVVAAQMNLVNGSNGSILVGLDRITVLRRVESFTSAVQLLTTSIVTLWTGDLVAIVACYSFWSLPMFLVNRRQASKELIYSGTTEIGSFDSAVFRAIWPSVWRSGVGILFSTGIIQGSALVVPQFVPAAQAAAYLLALRLISIVSQLSQAPFYSRLPEMARAKGSSDNLTVAEITVQGMRLAFWTFSIGVAALIVLGPIALGYIGSSVTLPSYPILATMALAFFAERYSAMHIQVYTLTNKVIWHTVNGFIGVCTVAGSSTIWSRAGILSLPLSMLISYGLVTTIFTVPISSSSIEMQRGELDRKTMLFPLISLVALMAFIGALQLL